MKSTVRAGAWLCLALATVFILTAPCLADVDRSVLESSRRATGFVLTEFNDVLSMGTGFCIDTSGLFITNNHVISNKGQYGRIKVVLAPGTPSARILSATVVKADPNLDLALLRVDRPNNLHTIDLAGVGRMGRLHETQEVMALGYPFGLNLAASGSAPEVSVSTGRITALRHVKNQLALIQFDGSINHGNSGGPLLDQFGNVIGVVTAIIPDKQINFALPVSFVRALLAEANIVIAPAALTEPDIRAQLIVQLTTPPKGRMLVPDAAAQQSARKLVLDLFSSAYADKSRTGQENLVYQLLDEARSDKDDPSGRFALLNEAKEAAIRVGNFPAAIYAAEELFDRYELRPTDLVADLLKRMGPGLEGQDAADGATASLLLVEALDNQTAFTEARKWMQLTREIAYASHNSKVVSAIAEGLARVEFDAAAAERASAAMVKLKSDPKDVAANLAVGQYQCLVRGDFAMGCTFLARTDDAGLKSAANAELAKPATPADQRACGDLWWDEAAALAKTPVLTDACKARAIYWYQLAVPKLTGLVKRAIEQRIGSRGVETAPVAATSGGQPVDGGASNWIDLLKMVDIERDAITGEWTLAHGVLSVNAAPGVRKLHAPVQPHGAYEVRLEYERPDQSDKDGSLRVALPVGPHSVGLIVTSQAIGLDTILGKRFVENETTRKGDFRDGMKHQLDITVTPSGDDAKISVSLDGQLQFDWSGPSSSLHPFWVWGNDSKGLCLGAWKSAHIITVFQLRELSSSPKSDDSRG